MKKILFIFCLLFFITANVEALEVKVKKCFPKSEGFDDFRTKTECGVSTKIKVNNNRCITLPINEQSRNDTTSKTLSFTWDQQVKKGWLHLYCDALIDNENFNKFKDCAFKFGFNRRQKCIEENKIFVYQPSSKLNGEPCSNDILGLKTYVIGVNSKKVSCTSTLGKYHPDWKLEYTGYFSSNKNRYIDFFEYTSLQNKNGNDENNLLQEKEEKKIAEEKRKAKEEEEKRIAEEKRKAKEEEEKRIAEAKKKEEEAKKAQDEELYVIGSGTGFFVNKEGYIVTNEHVAGICQSLASYINGETHLFKIIALDQRNDLALLRGEYRNKTYLNINVMGAEFGEDIMAFGFPLAENLSSSVKLTRGIVSSLSGPENDISLIQIDAAIQPGNSGGPVLNYNGQVVGVASSGLNKIQMLLDEESPYIPENVNFAVSANTLTSFLRSNSINIFNDSYEKKSSQELAKIGMPPTIQLHCLNTIAAHKKLRDSKNYNDVLLKKVVNLK